MVEGSEHRPERRPRYLGVFGLIVLAAVVIALIIALVRDEPAVGLPADLEPTPGDELASDEVAVADPLDEIPTADGLAAAVHGASAACDLRTRVIPESSSYVVLDAREARTLDGPTVCGATVLADGRLVAVLGYGTEQPQMSVVDPREPDGAFALPHELGERQFIAE